MWAVTFADESQEHTGIIYRATNWIYLGRTKPEPRWEDAEGRQVSRLATKSRTGATMLSLGYRVVGRYSKHKFVMPLRDAGWWRGKYSALRALAAEELGTNT